MTLNITVLTSEVIYQAADYRLFNTNTNRVEPVPSTKAIVIGNFEWTGFITYTGIGRVGTQDTADFVRMWIGGPNDLSFDGVVEAIRSSASSWVQRVKPGQRQTFVVAAFINGSPTAVIVSNFERWHGAQAGSVSTELFTSRVSCRGRPEVLVTGIRQAVPREKRRALKWLANRHRTDPARVRRALADAISDGADRFPDKISQDCFVSSQDIHGRGHEEVFGSARTTFPNVMPESARRAIEDDLEKQFGARQWTMRGATFASSSDTSEPPPTCTLTLLSPIAVAAPARRRFRGP